MNNESRVDLEKAFAPEAQELVKLEFEEFKRRSVDALKIVILCLNRDEIQNKQVLEAIKNRFESINNELKTVTEEVDRLDRQLSMVRFALFAHLIEDRRVDRKGLSESLEIDLDDLRRQWLEGREEKGGTK